MSHVVTMRFMNGTHTSSDSGPQRPAAAPDQTAAGLAIPAAEFCFIATYIMLVPSDSDGLYILQENLPKFQEYATCPAGFLAEDIDKINTWI